MTEFRWFGAESLADVRAAIRHVLRRSPRCENDVDDLVQTSFLRFLCALRDGRVHDDANVGGYLATIARNAAHDWLVARARDKRIRESEEPACDPGGGGPDRVDLRALHRYLSRLPSELASIYEMRFGGELSQLQVARALRMSRQQVRTLENRLLREGRRALRADADLDLDERQK
jgi:RNA polymerase sigma factor (sigma-70 family)